MTKKTAPDGPCVLITGHEPGSARQLEREFGEAGFRVEIALNTAEVLEAAAGHDLIVLDGRTPDSDTLSALRQLHARYGPETPSVLLLADDSSPHVDTALLVYPDSFVLARPWTPDAIVDAASRLLAVAT